VQLFRVVRIPFRVACVSGNLKMRLRVNQDRRTRKVRRPSMNHREPPSHADQTCTARRRTSLRSSGAFTGKCEELSRAVQIHFDSLKEGRLIKNFLATFDIVGTPIPQHLLLSWLPLFCDFAGCTADVLIGSYASTVECDPDLDAIPAAACCAETDPGRSTVHLDAKISAAQLPPPPFKSLVKGARPSCTPCLLAA